MKKIKGKGNVSDDGVLTIRVNGTIKPGRHSVLVLIKEQDSKKRKRRKLDFPEDSYGKWPEGLSLRREDIYGEDQR